MEQNLRKETKPTVFEQTQVERKKYDSTKKSLKSHLEQQWTTLALATLMKVVHSTRKISDVATKSSIFELKPPEPKKKRYFDFSKTIFQVPLETRMISTCNYNEAAKKTVMWQLSRQSLSRHQLNRKKKDFMKSPPCN